MQKVFQINLLIVVDLKILQLSYWSWAMDMCEKFRITLYPQKENKKVLVEKRFLKNATR